MAAAFDTFIGAFIEMLLVWTIHYFSDAQGPNAVNFAADPFISITPVAMVTVKLCDQIRNPFSMIDGVYYSNPGWYLCILLRKFYKIFPNLFDWVRLQVVISHTEDYVQFSLLSLSLLLIFSILISLHKAYHT